MKTSLWCSLSLLPLLITLSHAQTPEAKEAIAILLQNQDVPLSVDPSCKDLGTSRTDRTLGQYIAGFMAEQVGPAKNWIEASCQPASPAAKADFTCSVQFARHEGEEVWRWGVQFSLDSHRKVIRRSFRCIGAG